MKFTKFGKALLISALSAGVVLGVSSCIQDYTVGYLYVTGTTTGQTGSNGIVSGYYIDHNTGKLNQIHGLPVASGGANPIRAVLISGSRFLYVLNRGVNANGTANCSGTSGNTVCNGSNIEAFIVGGNGILTPQATYYTQGLNPFRMVADSSGNYLMVLDHDAPSAAGCQATLGSSTTTCGDITVFKIDSTTGRLSLVTNTQGTSTLGSSLTYFPVPANPIDFLLTGSNVLTLSGTTTTVNSVFPYTYTASTGQLTVSQNTSQPLGIYKATGMTMAGGMLYVMDNEAPSSNTTGATSMIIPYTVGSGGALQAQTVGQIADDPTLSNPSWLIEDAKSKFIYVANQGNNTTGVNAGSGITGYAITSASTFQLSFTTPSTFGSGSAPLCIVEDPSDQYIYTVNYNDSSITGRVLNPEAGVLTDMRVASTYKLDGPPTWAIMDGRTN
ncbi:MAG: beta-propeller fold lactonase family protein [Terracidiphilus sp.]|nr:beta-propeller fold lactonase family protein [Terracidiphilus sp.]